MERVIISGGGTGGHIFPAIAIANEIKNRYPNCKILFVGAQGKMEMEKVPAAGYEIKGLPIAGFQRKFTLSNFTLPFKILQSLWMANSILKQFKPDVVIGVGGYASGPTLKAAHFLNIPTLIQEQNSFPGKTNILLAKNVKAICTAYDGLEKYFPKNKIFLTGNPVRKEMVEIKGKREEAIKHFDLNPNKKTILIIGGSLGARTLNQAMETHYDEFANSDLQFLWQSGKIYFQGLESRLSHKKTENIHLLQFIDRMDLAYALADVIVSRAGAIAVSELCLVKKPVILVPSPNVADDHQTKNAMALVEKNAALLVKDQNAIHELKSVIFDVIENTVKTNSLSESIGLLGKPNATEEIVNTIEKIIK